MSIIQSEYMEGILTDQEYDEVKKVPAVQLISILMYLRNPKVSTQHGVKGESHDNVVFVAADNTSNPVVHMYRFFEIWGQVEISLNRFQQFYYSYVNELIELQKSIDMKVNELNKINYVKHEKVIVGKIKEIEEIFQSDPIFKILCAEKYEKFLSKPGVTSAKECLKENTVYGVLSAYKLFYVGCSRARKNLTVLVDCSKIKGNIELQKKKFEELGFVVY